MLKKHVSSGLTVVLSVLCLTVASLGAADAQEPLAERLGKIRAKMMKGNTDWPSLEAEHLSLIHDHNTPTDKGKIYAAVALMYSQTGYRSRKDPRIPKALEYCPRALQYPLDPVMACKMYSKWSGALMVKARDLAPAQFAVERRKALIPCLAGLRLALDNNAPKDYPASPGPGVPRINVDATSPDYERLRAEHERRMAAGEKWLTATELHVLRSSFVQQCVTLYTHEPYDTTELTDLASVLLIQYPSVVGEVVAGVEARLAEIQNQTQPDNPG